MFSSERALFRGGVVRGAVPPAPRRAPEPDGAAASWLPDDLVLDADFGALPELDAADAGAAAGLAPEELAALHAAEEAERQAAEARRAAEAAAREAARHAEQLDAAYAAGLEAGRAEGEAVARAELDAVVGALMQALADVRGSEQRWLGALEENVAALATAVARHVLAREVAADPAAVVALARHAIAEFPVDEPITLRVAPEDLPAVKAALVPAPGGPPTRETRCVGDAHVARGGVLVEGRERIVDGRVDTALERIYRRLSHHHA